MSEINSFTEEVSEGLGNYVYRLIDPRNGETFYIGKGKGNRVFDHANGNFSKLEAVEDSLSTKQERIVAIKDSGLSVLHVIHRHGIPDDAIFEVEAALIDCYPGLENIQGGHYSADRGPMNVKEVIVKYGLPSFPEVANKSFVLININQLKNRYDRGLIYEQVRLAWRIDSKRASKADFVLAVVRGVVVGVFTAEKWMPATHSNFPERVSKDFDESKRKGFVGDIAPDGYWNEYVGEHGKRLVDKAMMHNQNPIKYWNV
jgi:hypothetical protein